MRVAAPGTTRIGWIGTGVMGRSMCGHLISKGYKATIYSRTRDKAADLVAKGAEWAASPREVAEKSDVVFSIVGFPADVREVILGPKGALAGAKPESVIVDMTTSEPSLAREIDAAAKAKGLFSLDAPVSGGDIGARNAALSIMVGGETAVVEAIRPLFECMGKSIIHQGPVGSGQHTKMVNQILIAGTMLGLAEALSYARRSGLNPATVLESVGGGAAASWSLANLAPRVLRDDFAPGFFIEHFVKDLRIALDEAQSLGLELPTVAAAERAYAALADGGHARSGTQAIVHAYGW